MEEARFWKGFAWGIVATLVMSAFMLAGIVTGVSPMPKPIPAAILGKILGGAAPKPAVIGLAALAHLGYGGVWGGILARWTKPVTVAKGLGLGIGLWLLMQLVVLPFLGWGVFGTALTPKIAVATLVLHLIYGVVLGWLLDR